MGIPTTGTDPPQGSLLDRYGYGPSATDAPAVVVVGCGNLLRGDDAIGPLVVRELAAAGLPKEIALVDGGTAGIDVAFRMRGAKRAILIDAAATGSDPGTIFRVPADALVDEVALSGVHSHAIRWDHSLALAKWLLGSEIPQSITVYLVEAGSLEVGEGLSKPVERAKELLVATLLAEINDDADSPEVQPEGSS